MAKPNKPDIKRVNKRIGKDKIAQFMFFLSTVFTLFILAILIIDVFIDSIGWLDIRFLTSKLSMNPEKAGIYSVIIGTVLLMCIVTPVTLVLGISTAIYLEEFSRKGKLHKIIETNISNLAGVPSVIFGLLGLTVFGRWLKLGSSVLSAGLTLSLLVLPIVVVSCQEAIRAVPNHLKDASYAMGATKWTTLHKVVLPAALPGILTGSILALSRAMGETAPLVVLGIPALILKTPTSIMDDFTSLPLQIYYWTLDSVLVKEYTNIAAASIVVLLVLLFAMNSTAIYIRNKYQKRY